MLAVPIRFQQTKAARAKGLTEESQREGQLAEIQAALRGPVKDEEALRPDGAKGQNGVPAPEETLAKCPPYTDGSWTVGTRPATSTPAGTLLDRQALRFHCRATRSERLRVWVCDLR